jgi:hypothetical protein
MKPCIGDVEEYYKNTNLVRKSKNGVKNIYISGLWCYAVCF